MSKRGCALRYFVYAKPRALYSVTHPERNLKIEYIYIGQNYGNKSVGANSGRPTNLALSVQHTSTMCVIPNNIYVFTNHVGDGALDVPTPRQPLSPAWLVNKIQTSLLRAGCRISVSLRTEISPSPYNFY